MKIFHKEEEAVAFLLNFAMPFILHQDPEIIDDDTESVLDIYERLEEQCELLANQKLTMNLKRLHCGLYNSWVKSRYPQEHGLIELNNNIDELKTFLKTVCLLATDRFYDTELSGYTKSQIEERFNKAMSDNQVVWQRLGDCNLLAKRIEEPQLESLKLVERVVLNAVLTCLYSSFNLDDYYKAYGENSVTVAEVNDFYAGVKCSEKVLKHLRLGEGHNRIGCCTECKKLFLKNRKDKTYCSKKCKDAYVTRRLRKEKRGEPSV